jgi:phospholipase/carboxylesterase
VGSVLSCLISDEGQENLAMEARLMHASVKELREIIAAAGLSSNDCVNKADLRTRAAEAVAKNGGDFPAPAAGVAAPAAAAAASSTAWKARSKATIGGFECEIVGDLSTQADLVVVFFHGYNASAAGFADLAHEFGRHPNLVERAPRIRWVFPQAAPKPEWWPLDLMKWQMAMMSGQAEVAKMLRETPEGLPEASERAKALVAAVEAWAGVPTSKVCVGGFSQGAMMTVEAALSLDKKCAGALVVSGFPIVIEQWAEKCTSKHGLSVMQTHGRADPLLPFQCAGWLKDLLVNGGLDVEFSEHSGAHDLGGPSTVAAIAAFLARL